MPSWPVGQMAALTPALRPRNATVPPSSRHAGCEDMRQKERPGPQSSPQSSPVVYRPCCNSSPFQDWSLGIFPRPARYGVVPAVASMSVDMLHAPRRPSPCRRAGPRPGCQPCRCAAASTR